MRRGVVVSMLVVSVAMGATLTVRSIPSYPESDTESTPQGVLTALTEIGCVDAEQAARCIRAKIDSILTSGTPSDALTSLRSWSDAAAPDPFPCHGAAHYLGREVVRRNSDLEQLVQLSFDGPENCADGYVHGILEGVGLYQADGMVPVLDRLCRIDVADVRFGTWCRHATGHAAAMAGGGDLERSIRICEQFDATWLEECVGGVFMTFGGGGIAFDDSQVGLDQATSAPRFAIDDLTGVCTRLSGGHNGCWEFLWMSHTMETYDTYINDCAAATGDGVRLCGYGAARLMANYEEAVDAALASQVARCERISSGSVEFCVRAVLEMEQALLRASGREFVRDSTTCMMLPVRWHALCAAVSETTS